MDTKPTYIVAVSGGVDSVVLLHRLATQNEARLVVAHVDHGIRSESGEDAAFVAALAADYGFEFESIKLSLGPHASELTARVARWEFLRRVKAAYQATVITTAHHADDVVETIILNLKRGTGWRGLASLRETDEIKRPLLELRKSEIIAYARQHELVWHEDITNQDPRLTRNAIRQYLIPRLSDDQFQIIFRLFINQMQLRHEIESELHMLAGQVMKNGVMSRYLLSMWPDEVATEMLRIWLGALPRQELSRALLFARVTQGGKTLQLSNGHKLFSQPRQIIVERPED